MLGAQRFQPILSSRRAATIEAWGIARVNAGIGAPASNPARLKVLAVPTRACRREKSARQPQPSRYTAAHGERAAWHHRLGEHREVPRRLSPEQKSQPLR